MNTAIDSTAPLAAAEPPTTQAPGYYRIMIGNIEVTALNDGIDALPAAELLTHVKPHEVARALERNYLSDLVPTSLNAFLVNTGGRLLLIDAGGGQLLGPGLGKLIANLQAAGYRPEQVQDIYLTHMHRDHIGGLMAGGVRAFPNATVHAARGEAEYWLSPAQLAAAPDAGKASFHIAMDSLNPYIAAGKFSSFDGDAQLAPGVSAQATRGHTPGHTAYRISSMGQTMLVWGDLVHVAAVQFDDPSVTLKFDADPAQAAATRQGVFKDAAAKRYWVAGAHLSFPGIGHVRADPHGYTWVPATYGATPP